jgi:hypothetical protein
MQITHPHDSRIIFEAVYHEGEKATDEYNYSLGDPLIESRYEITAVAWNDGTSVSDITEFVLQYCDKLLPEWENLLITQ